MGQVVIYANANVVIRLVKGDDATRARLEARLRLHLGTSPIRLTSRLGRLECRVKPLREHNAQLLELYEAFFRNADVQLVELTEAVVELATQIRASQAVSTPDALHLASAFASGASTFLPGDRSLSRYSDISVEVL